MRNFTLYRITLRDSPAHHVVVHNSDGFTAWGVNIMTPETARNTDGIDPRLVHQRHDPHCYIHAGDDNVAIGSRPGAAGLAHFHSGRSLLHRPRHVHRQRHRRWRQPRAGEESDHRRRARTAFASSPIRAAAGWCTTSGTRTSASAT